MSITSVTAATETAVLFLHSCVDYADSYSTQHLDSYLQDQDTLSVSKLIGLECTRIVADLHLVGSFAKL